MENLISFFTQGIIILSGCLSIWLVSRKEEWRKWGFLIGLVGQPFWILTTYSHEQWGIL